MEKSVRDRSIGMHVVHVAVLTRGSTRTLVVQRRIHESPDGEEPTTNSETVTSGAAVQELVLTGEESHGYRVCSSWAALCCSWD